MNSFFKFLWVVSIFSFSGLAASYYVSPMGSDGNDGSFGAPFATISKARDAMRPANAGMTADNTIYLRGGWYFQSAILAFTQADGGTNGKNVIYQAYPGEYPVISGGRQITGWTIHNAAKNIWKATASGLNTRQLYVNCIRADRAHSRAGLPGASAPTSSGYTTSDNTMQNWRNISDIEFVFNPKTSGGRAWEERRCGVASISGTNITMKSGWSCVRTSWAALSGGPSDIENAYELLSEPGEWYYDRPAGVVYYIPRPTDDMVTATVIAPVLETLVSATGALGNPVTNMQFKGITFAHATWLRPSLDAGFCDGQANNLTDNSTMVPGNVKLSTVHNFRFERCTFKHLGGVGLDLQNGAQNNTIIGCVFTDISSNCLQIGKITDADRTDTRAREDNNIVTNCYIHDSPIEYRSGVGVLAGHVSNLTLSYNEICDNPYSGISLGWGWDGTAKYPRNNVMSYNKIHDNMEVLEDGGSIYTLSAQISSSIHHNYIYNWHSNGLYLDEGTSYMNAYSNVVKDRRQLNPMNVSWLNINNVWSQRCHDDTVQNNFYDWSQEVNGGQRMVNNTLVTNGQWPAAAQTIMTGAGIQSAYTDVLTMPCACKVMDVNNSSTVKPALISARVIDPIHIEIIFNKGAEPTSAQTIGNYQISGGTTIASIAAIGEKVTITTIGPLAENALYTITVSNVRDRQLTPNTIIANSTINAGGLGYNLVGWWKFNETSGSTVSDASGHGFNGTITGTSSWSSGKLGGALTFGSSTSNSANVSIPAGAIGSLTGDCAATAWVYITNKDNWSTIFGGSKMKLNIWSCNCEFSLLGYGKNTSACGDYYNRWLHIVIQKRGKVAQYYRDGELIMSDSAGSSVGSEIWSIGANRYNGMIDDVRLYNRTLSGAEIKQLAGGYAGPGSMSIVTLDKPATRSVKMLENISIFAVNGALVKELKFSNKEIIGSFGHFSLSKGVYIVKSVSSSKSIVRKIVVQGKGEQVISQILNIQ